MDFNIPDGDDAHLIFLPLPEDVESDVEDWFITEIAELTRPSSVQFLKDLSNMSNDIASKVKNHRVRSKIVVNVEEEESQTVARNQALTYFRPTIIKNLSKSSSKGWNAHRGNYRFCLSARGAGDVRIIFDTIRISEYQDKLDKKHIVKKEHLTPLERAFDESSALAKDVIDEMHYMEKRELRMKKTADGTNRRIRYFSYVSIVILVGITWLQLQYMKSYFKKKKIL
jgi:hypothetical protein